MQQKSVILIGAGNRGVTYTDCMYEHSQKYKIVGVAEPNPIRRQYIVSKHGLTDNQYFDNHGYSISPISVICDNHLTTLAAEFSRVNDGITVDVQNFKKQITK